LVRGCGDDWLLAVGVAEGHADGVCAWEDLGLAYAVA
jgi:hypothetical protein